MKTHFLCVGKCKKLTLSEVLCIIGQTKYGMKIIVLTPKESDCFRELYITTRWSYPCTGP